MAKLRGKAKMAFLRRMARGRAKARRGSGVARARRSVSRPKGYSGSVYRSKTRPGVVRFRVRPNPRGVRRSTAGGYEGWLGRTRDSRALRKKYQAATRRRRVGRRLRNPLQALIANPGSTALVPYGYAFPARKRRKRKGATSMAKRKRRSGRRRVRRYAPRRRTYRRRPIHRRRRRGRARGIARVRRGTRVIYINPRRGRHGHRIRRRRNPGFGGILRMAFVPYATGIVTSGLAAMLDSGLAAWPMTGNLVKVGAVFGIAAFFGRKHPLAASAAIGALGASQGYPMVTKLAGGIFAHTPAAAVKGLGEMSETYPEMGALLQGGLGALLQGPTDVPMTSTNYQTALQNMADDDDDS